MATIEAGNALFRSVVVHAEFAGSLGRLHGAYLVAHPAIDAICIAFGKYRSKSVEKGQTRAQGTDHLAEESVMPHHQDYNGKQYSKPNGKVHQVSGSVDDRPRYGRFDGANRTNAAKIQSERRSQKDGNQDHEADEQAVFYEPGPRGDAEFYVRNFVQQVLNESERTRPAAEKPTRNETGHGNGSYHGQRKETDGRKLSYHSQRTGKYGNRAGMAIQYRKTNEVPFEQTYIEEDGKAELNFES